MKTAAIYCRVSTDNQEREGTSLQTQLENCLTYCHEKDYEVAYRFSEAYSGLSLERPELDKLRELVRSEQIDVGVCYSLDRLTRDPNHGVIITQELEKHCVTLETVTEDVDNTELGQLITYIRNYASKIEAIKIKERTSRGRRAKAKLGHITGGGFARTYGYDYVKKHDGNTGRREINDSEASIVRQMYHWLINDGMSTTGITNRLNDLRVSSKRGGYWSKQAVLGILTNKSYTGKTYAFTTVKGRKQFTRPQSDWIEIEGVTPSIINQEVFEAAQKQLQVNRNKTVTITKHKYLLRGHIRCRHCGRAYTGGIHSRVVKGKRYAYTRYRCMGKVRQHSPVERCHNKNWFCSKLDPIVWTELERYLSDHDFIEKVLNDQCQETDQISIYESELKRIERQLKATDREQHQLLQWALKGFPESQVEAENRRLNKAKESLHSQKTESEKQLKISQNATINVSKLEDYIQDIQDKLPNLDFEGKRLALDMLNITVWIDGENIEITGIIEPELLGVTQTTPVYL